MEETQVSRGAESGGAIQGNAPALVGIRGRLRADAKGAAVALIAVDDGRVTLTRGGGDAQAVLSCESESDALAILRGDLNPVVAALQGRLEISGDLVFAIKALNGIRGGSLFTAQQQQPQGEA